MKGKEPEELMDKRIIKNKVAHFTIVGDELYMKMVLEGSPLTICVSNQEGRMIATSIHQGGGGTHQGARNLIR